MPPPLVSILTRRAESDQVNDPNETDINKNDFGSWRNVNSKQAFIVEGWSQGFMVGALFIMAVITIANMKRKVLLHRLILLELFLAMSHGTFCFMSFKGYGYYLSATATLLYASYFLHNLIAWMKIRPFFTGRSIAGPRVSKIVSITYVTTLMMSAPVQIFQAVNNFRYFNNFSTLFVKVRPYEPLFRDPWWVFSVIVFFHCIGTSYSLKPVRLMKRSPRFLILNLSMILSLIFTTMDILASLIPSLSETSGINPYWKLALVFKCLTDNIMLDDFKSVLQKLGALKLDGQGRDIRTDALTPSGNAYNNGGAYYEPDSVYSQRDPLQSDTEERPRRRRRQICARCACTIPIHEEKVDIVDLSMKKTNEDDKEMNITVDSDSGRHSESASQSPFGPDVPVGVLPGLSHGPNQSPPSAFNNQYSRFTHIRPLPSMNTDGLGIPNPNAGGRLRTTGFSEIGFPISDPAPSTPPERPSPRADGSHSNPPWEQVTFASTPVVGGSHSAGSESEQPLVPERVVPPLNNSEPPGTVL